MTGKERKGDETMGGIVTMTMTKDEWQQKGKELFGDDMLDWRFVCPSCGNVQTPRDFKPYKDPGATPGDACSNCIGRFDGHGDVEILSGKSPCNYASGGLFNFNPVRVLDGDKVISSFAFAPVITDPT